MRGGQWQVCLQPLGTLWTLEKFEVKSSSGARTATWANARELQSGIGVPHLPCRGDLAKVPLSGSSLQISLAGDSAPGVGGYGENAPVSLWVPKVLPLRQLVVLVVQNVVVVVVVVAVVDL